MRVCVDLRTRAHVRVWVGELLHQTACKCNKPIRTRAKKNCNGWKAPEMTRDEPQHNWFYKPDRPKKKRRSDWLGHATGEPIINGLTFLIKEEL